MSDEEKAGCSVITLIAIFIIGIVIWIFESSMEAAAFNAATGNHVSTWDAMWIELRVQDAPMNKVEK
jgi:hypothetical protein